jgi:hypothetical protein
MASELPPEGEAIDACAATPAKARAPATPNFIAVFIETPKILRIKTLAYRAVLQTVRIPQNFQGPLGADRFDQLGLMLLGACGIKVMEM